MGYLSLKRYHSSLYVAVSSWPHKVWSIEFLLRFLSVTHFTKNMLFTIPVQWKIHIAVMWLPVTRWLQIFPHLTPTELFCYMETFLWSLQNTFPSGLKSVERTISWMVPWHIIFWGSSLNSSLPWLSWYWQHRWYGWLCTRLQYLYWLYTGDTAVSW